MPEKKTVEKARQAKRRGRSPSTQAGEFVHEEIRHVREGKHGARSPEQAIAIGLSKARRAGVALAPPEKGKTSQRARRQAKRDLAKGARKGSKTSLTRSRATKGALKREGRKAAAQRELAGQARRAAKKRTPVDRPAAARKAARTRQAKRK